MSFEHRYAQPVDVEDDQSNVRVVSGGNQKKMQVSDLSGPVRELNIDEWDSTMLETGREKSVESQPSRRQAIIDEGTELGYQALELFRQAVDVISITDINARTKYGDVLKGLASAVEDFENKL